MNGKFLVGIVLALLLVSFHSAYGAEEAAQDRPDPMLTFGGLTTEDYSEGIGDVVLPLYFNGRSLVFINPRFSFTDRSEEEYNLGIGYRLLIREQQALVGANVFYDRRETALGTTFDQVGIGAEYLSHFIDARANVYLPLDDKELVNEFSVVEQSASRRSSTSVESYWTDPYATGHDILQAYETIRRTQTRTTRRTTTRYFHEYEVALRGWDAEVGARLPIEQMEDHIRVKPFAGYYRYEGRHGVDTIDGFRGRLEVHIKPSFFIDAVYYADDELTGGNWSVGAYVSVPLDLSALANRRNPFAGAMDLWDAGRRREDIGYRLADLVRRDPQIRTRVTEPREQVHLEETVRKSRTEETVSVERQTYTVATDITFVDGSRGRDANPGTFEAPKLTIQGGVNQPRSMVFVYDINGAYNENVVMHEGVYLHGSGVVIPAYGGKSYGSGIHPIVDGRSMGPTITLADRTLIRGFHIRNTERGGPAHVVELPIEGGTYDVRRTGILGNDVTDLAIMQNIIAGNEDGVLLARQGNFNLFFDQNWVTHNDGHGLWIEGAGDSGVFSALIQNSRFSNNAGNGALIRARDYDYALMHLRNNGFLGNGMHGAHLEFRDNAVAAARISGATAANNAGAGILSELLGNGSAAFVAADILAVGNAGPGMFLTITDSSHVNVQVDRFRAPDSVFVFMGSDLNGPVRLAADVEAGDFIMFLERVIANGAVGDGVGVNVQTREGDAFFLFNEIEASNNSGSGVSIQAASADGNIFIIHESVEAVNNARDGISLAAHAGGQAIYIGNEITATDNDRHGVNVELSGHQEAVFILVESVASRNTVDGVRFVLFSDGGAAGNNAIAIIYSSEALDNGLVDVRGTVAASGEGDAIIILVADHDSHDLTAVSEFGDAVIIVIDP